MYFTHRFKIQKKPITLEGIACNPETKIKKTIDIILDYVYDIFVSEGLFQEKLLF